jgi:hypothetical protein
LDFANLPWFAFTIIIDTLITTFSSFFTYIYIFNWHLLPETPRKHMEFTRCAPKPFFSETQRHGVRRPPATGGRLILEA